MTRYERAAQLFHASGGSWFVRTVHGQYLYLAVDLTTRDLGLVKDLKRHLPESWIVLRQGRGYASWRLTRQVAVHNFLKALLPLLPAIEQLRLAEALGRTARAPDARSRFTACGVLLRRLRHRARCTQEALAKRASCTIPTIRSNERGRSIPSAPLAARLELALQAPGLAGFLGFWRKFRWTKSSKAS